MVTSQTGWWMASDGRWYPPETHPGYRPPPGGFAGWGPPPVALPKAGSDRTGPLPLHPMSLSDILDGVFKLFKANARTIFTIVAVLVVPFQILAALLQRNLFHGQSLITVFNDPSAATTAGTPGGGARFQIVSVAVAGINLALAPFVAGAIAKVVAASYLGEQLSAGTALRAVARRWWALLAAWVLCHLLELVGFALCILPGLVVMTFFVAVAPAIVTEGLGPIAGMRRSRRLVKRRLWPTMGVALLGGLMASTVGNVLGVVPTFAALLVGLRWGWILLAAGNSLVALVVTPLIAILATLIYFDARIRTEGFDLQIIAADLARGPGTG